ncbi:MAG: bifunctional nuclease family protein [Bacillota bacterium]
MIEVKVHRIGFDPDNNQAVILLRDEVGGRSLPLWIGMPEASAIALSLQGVNPPRPMTHDLLKSLLDLLNVKVTMVLIDDLKEQTFYAQVTLESSAGTHELDSRPSDAIALALRASAPIYAMDRVLELAGIVEQSEGEQTH